jgi:hypothetical protein
VHLSKKVCFRFHGKTKLTREDSIEQLTALLIELCHTGSEIIDVYDARRYNFLLRALSNFPLPENLQRQLKAVLAGAVRISHLPSVVSEWLMSQWKCESRLLSHHMMDTANFIDSMLTFGTRGNYPCSWWLEPLGSDLLPHGIMIDAALKGEFTKMNRVTVIAVVPEDTVVVSPGLGKERDRAVFASGAKFRFVVNRCHLSHAIGEYRQLKIAPDLSLQRYDVCHIFRLPGYILPCEDVQEEKRAVGNEAPRFFDLPPRWITHEVLYDSYGRVSELLPAPTWELPSSSLKPLAGDNRVAKKKQRDEES